MYLNTENSFTSILRTCFLLLKGENVQETNIPGLLERLKSGGTILIAEGYLWEFERRGYMKAGAYVPEVVLEHPEMVRLMHREFVHAGSDVCEAFTYYGHRNRLKIVGRQDDTEKLNRTALKIAREVADETGTLMAGNICHTGLYQENNPEAIDQIKAMFKEQVEWAVQEGADYIIGESHSAYGEAKLALEAIQQYGKGIPAVITITCYFPDETTDGVPIRDACRQLEEAGAAVVGMNCTRGPRTMLPALREIRKACKGPIAALPVPFRTSEECRTFQSLKDPETGKPLKPTDRACAMCSQTDIREFAEEAKKIGIDYIGLCCGNAPNYFREIVKVYGRKPEAVKYSADFSVDNFWGESAYDDNHDVKKLREYMFKGKA